MGLYWRNLDGGYGNAGMRPERRFRGRNGGRPNVVALHVLRSLNKVILSETSIRLVEQFQLTQKADPISSCKRSIASEDLSFTYVVNAGFDLNHDDGNLALSVQDGTAGKGKIRRAALLSGRNVEVEDGSSVLYIYFGRRSSANAWRRMPRGHCYWSPQIGKFSFCHQFCLKYRIGRLRREQAILARIAINPGSARAEPSQ